MTQEIRIGLIGAGYIADWHADALGATPGVRIAAICDPRESAAKTLADQHGAEVFTSVDNLIESKTCDAVHILTPPNVHEGIATQCLSGGLNVLVEKPVAESAEATRRIADTARTHGQLFAPGHNFLGLPSYVAMKRAMQEGDYGRIHTAEILWALPLAPLRSGPFNLWLLQQPQNLLLELGPHLVAFAHDLFGEIEITHAEAGHPVMLPGDDARPQSFRILARAGHVNLSFQITMVETVDDRSVTLRGSSARACLDYAADTLTVERENASDLIVNPLRKQLDVSEQRLKVGAQNAWTQARSLNTRSPYAQSFRGMGAAIYGAMAKGAQDPRFSAESAVAVMDTIDRIIDALPEDVKQVAAPAVQTRQPNPTAMVIGGTGFIGRALTRRLVETGRDVRVVSRGRSGPFPDLPDQVETVPVDLYDLDALTEAMQGIEVVYNLARAMTDTWQDALIHDVGVATRIGMACEKAGVKRLVYTGTIASYDMSDPTKTISETTGFADDMTDRNMYARSKAECEKQLLKLHRERGLPLTIARPGIVVGPGGPLQHWGIGRWHGAGAVRIWGHGRNILPFVLNDDVADGLIAMGEADAVQVEGQSFNLIGEPMLSARDYFDAIHDQLGARIRVVPGNLNVFYASDAVKYLLKKHALRRKAVIRPSRADWQSRAHFSHFDNGAPKRVLGWQPEADRARFIDRAITQAGLFGF
ncbi:putative dehydrogenase/nucleoside-diphosphate-sugar epimerase [Sagittula marina]|uniref:Putative dehydrogenase/nucleoside-diphosphate-sugar epimerase n=1 Tax=Sagittula marina TaxID=943940 RepID=A0A7W6DNH9_9RHOB|nr:NAD-dependent epimerase/dehydratase family protein [Sagittula marina]MBB3983835.1 putative dehydrogenase/nucleoside-diphosphate-sugar epimerase [Sagittula marina]